MNPRRFRIAFSFAGEKRDFVAQVAAILAARFRQEEILYDKYHKAEFSRTDLAFYLPELYHKESDLIVAVFCPDYPNKEWCGLEWSAIFDLLKKGHVQQVMPTRFGHVEGPGLNSLSGYTDLHHETPESAATLILERLALNECKAKNHYTATAASPAAPSTTTPNNLPRLQPFFGREAELRQIREALDPAAHTWGILVYGLGGMGKTSLAIHAAHGCPPGLFDQIIFTSVKDRDMDDDAERYIDAKLIPGFLEMLDELARELGQPGLNSVTESERSHLILVALRPLKVLLILDNLETLTKAECDQLLTFVKRLPAGCKAILTSRDRIGNSGNALILERLDQDAALATLAELAKHNKLLAEMSEDERIVLHTQTGGNSLLLRWTAGQLGLGSCRTFTDAISYLRSCPAGKDPLEFVFGDLAREFTDAETKVLCALTYFTQPATVEHIATVAGAEAAGGPRARAGDLQSPSVASEPAQTATASRRHETAEPSGVAGEKEAAPPILPSPPFDLAAVETALRTLANRSLVVPDQEKPVYTLVPMVADFLRKKKPEVVAETGNCLENRAYALIEENGDKNYDRFHILDKAWGTVAPALPLFVAGPNPRLQKVCDKLKTFLDFTGRWDEWLSLNLQAEDEAVAAGDHMSAGWRAYHMGIVHNLRQQPDEVLACAERAAKYWEKAQAGNKETAFVFRLRGFNQQLKQNYPDALDAYRKAHALHSTIATESVDVVFALHNLGAIKRRLKLFAAAEQDFSDSLELASKIGDQAGVAILSSSLAGLARDREDWPLAEALARKALPISEQLGREDLIAINNHRIAEALVHQGKRTAGLPYAQRAVKILTQLRSPRLKDAQDILQECQA